MAMADALPWLNLLLVPALGLLLTIQSRLAAIEERQRALAGRLTRLDGIKA